ncbi:hypothetical protein SCAR479_12208 [Seiridium cardinale]|uniref:LITAF domain-containing protein n=1 Tax=Seiridium cardinale TaxID=138064 RepID=A0ABR2XBF9_9PEZI
MGAEPQPQNQPQNGPVPPQPAHQASGTMKGYQPAVNPAMVHPTPLHLLGEASAIIDCPYCNQRAPTRVDEHDSSMTIVAGIGLGILCICAACLPCLLHWFQDVDHFCSHCNQRVAHVPHGGIAQVIQPQQVPQGYTMEQQPQYGAQSPQPQQHHQQPPQAQAQYQQHQQQTPQPLYEAQSPPPPQDQYQISQAPHTPHTQPQYDGKSQQQQQQQPAQGQYQHQQTPHDPSAPPQYS